MRGLQFSSAAQNVDIGSDTYSISLWGSSVMAINQYCYRFREDN